MSTIYHHNIIQGSPEWHELRRGIVTSSTVAGLITATGKIADNETVRNMAYKMAAERINGRIEKSFTTYEMERGHTEEVFARDLYAEKYSPVVECGLAETSRLGFRVGYSPDGLVGDDGLIEVKSRMPKFQIQTICAQAVPSEYRLQIQSGLWVSQRKWCDFIQYSNGMAMYVHRATPDLETFDLIERALCAFELRVAGIINDYKLKSEGLHVAEYIQHVDGSEIEVSND